MIFQLCSRDEYGASTIHQSTDDITLDGLKSLVTAGKGMVTADNMENALALDEQLRDFNSVFVEFVEGDEEIENIVYSGKRLGNKETLHLIILDGDKTTAEQKNIDDVKIDLRFFIGEVVENQKEGIKKTYYLEETDPKNRTQKILVKNFNNSLLEGKTWYFINIVE